MDTVLEIARAILLIGGALSMILLLFLLLTAIQVFSRVNGLISDIRYKYDLFQHFLLLPFKRLSKYFEEDDEDTD